MRPINADDFKEYVCSMSPKGIFSEWDTAGIYGAIDRQPTLDVEPVRHGSWHLASDTEFICELARGFVCSVCNEEIIAPRRCIDNTSFCPYCGAKMDLKEE